MRRTFCCLVGLSAGSVGALSDAASTGFSASKLSVLHKLLTGETQFRNNALLKVCNIEHNFGPNWKSEIEAYAEKLPASEKELLKRQVARVSLTRYTTRELAMYCGEGPTHLDKVAQQENLLQGKTYLEAHGAEEFEKYVKAEAKNANWCDADCEKFIKDVKAFK